MTPEEHYAEAERLLSAVNDQVCESEGTTVSADVADTLFAVWNLGVGRGTLHARLAEVGLQLRQLGDALAGFSEAHKVGETDDTVKRHDFPADVSDRGTGRNCRKCGRCEKHQGAECAGRQEHSTAKTCMVCLNPMGWTA